MKFIWLTLFGVFAISIKENFCIPAARPRSQGAIIYPEEDWDNCFLDEASTRAGLCKRLEECPDVLKNWDKTKVYPKTCYFIKQQQFVCCPILTKDKLDSSNITPTTTTEKLDSSLLAIFNTKPGIYTLSPDSQETSTTTLRPSNIFLDKVHNKTTTTTTNKPFNIFLDKFKNQTTTTSATTQNPFNIFLDNQTTTTTTIQNNIFLDKFKNQTTTTTQNPFNIFLDKFKNQTTTTTSITTQNPFNIFLDEIKNETITTTKKPTNIFSGNLSAQKTTESSAKLPFDIFVTGQPAFIRRRSETECLLQNPEPDDEIDVDGALDEGNIYPFMAILGWRCKIDDKIWYSCGGVLISSNFVLTAAHCLDISGEKPSFVHLGDGDLTDSKEGAIKIRNIFIHPNYDDSLNNDLALVELEEEVSKPVACLWIQHDLPIARYTVMGYGRISFKNASAQHLLIADVNTLSDSQTWESYEFKDELKIIGIVENSFCYGDADDCQHFCQGDTGGPLIMELAEITYVVGITSFGLGCTELAPSTFTRVSSYIDWIETIVWPPFDVRLDHK